jgi:hypothetical protein
MTDRKQFEAMLEALINEDQETAKELFHNIVVAKSREIYEELLESDFPPAKDEEEDDSEEGDDSDIGGDATDDFEKDVEDDGEDDGEDDTEFGGDEEPEGDVEDRVQDLEDALEDLKAEFEHMLAGEEHEEETGIAGDHNGELDDMENDMGGEGDMGDEMEDESMDSGAKTIHHVHHNAEDVGMPYESIDSDEQLIREYVEKVGMNWDTEATSKEGQHVGAQSGSVTGSTNVRSTVNGSMINDMGGTTGNIAQNHVEVHGDAGMKSTVKGPGVIAPNVVPNPDAKGNINVPGGKAGKTGFKTQVKDGNWESKKTSQDGKAVGSQSGSVTGSTNTKSTVNGTVGGSRKK